MHGSVAVVVMVVAHILPLGHHSGLHRQPGRVVIFVPLADIPDDGEDDHAENQKEYQRKENRKETAKKEVHGKALLF